MDVVLAAHPLFCGIITSNESSGGRIIALPFSHMTPTPLHKTISGEISVAPPRRPNHLKILAGEREDRINRNEPTPTNSTVAPAAPLSDAAQAIWDRVAPDLIDKHVLTAWDVDMFTVFCDAAATYYECRARMGDSYAVAGSVKNIVVNPYWRIMRDCAETMARIGARFGLTPSDRAGIDISASTETPKYGPERILG
jgi:P27 family predicted phage terminase small subunit